MTLRVRGKLGAAPPPPRGLTSVPLVPSAPPAGRGAVSGPHPQVQGWQRLGRRPLLAPLRSVGLVGGEGKARAGGREGCSGEEDLGVLTINFRMWKSFLNIKTRKGHQFNDTGKNVSGNIP